jgi:hypothetical protein
VTHNERRREQWPEHHDHPFLVLQRLLKQTQSPIPGHVPRSVCAWGPGLIAVYIVLRIWRSLVFFW